MKTGMTIISAVIFLALTISITALIYQMGMPVIERMQQIAALNRMKAVFSEIDQKIQEIASEGNGSRRVMDLDFTLGRMALDTEKNILFWEIQSKQPLMFPRTAEYFGNMIVGSNLEAKLYEGFYNSTPAWILENSHLRVYIKKIGSPQTKESYNTSDVLLAVYQKDLSEWLPLEYLKITVDENPLSESGTGYTYPERFGEDLPYAQVNAYMNSDYINYTIRFTLESGTDFLKIEGNI